MARNFVQNSHVIEKILAHFFSGNGAISKRIWRVFTHRKRTKKSFFSAQYLQKLKLLTLFA